MRMKAEYAAISQTAGEDASRTIQARSLADPDPYKASESPLLNNPEWGVQLKPPSAVSVSGEEGE